MASISEGVDDDDQSVTSAALGIESSATSFTEHSGALHAALPRHVLLELDDDRVRPAAGHGPRYKRSRDEPAATPPRRSPRRR